MFKDREAAVEKLSESIEDFERPEKFDKVVAVTFSGLQTAERISEELGISLETVISLNLNVPGNSELAFGAVARDGTLWIDDAMVEEFMIDENFIRERTSEVQQNIREDSDLDDAEACEEVKSQDILIVTDGVASGMRISASIGSCLKKGAESITVATPFISETAHDRISGLADEIIYIKRPRFVVSVNDGYASQSRKSN